MTVSGRKPDYLTEVKCSGLVSCNITTPLYTFACQLIHLKDESISGLGSNGFARHYSRHRYLLSFPQPTKMFQFSWFPTAILFYSDRVNTTWLVLGFPIRKSPDCRLLTATRSLSQSSTSFIGNIRLGIHFVPLSTFLCIDLTSNC